MWAGFDISMSSLWGAAMAWDATTRKIKGPVFSGIVWTKDDHYFKRIKEAVSAHNFIHDMQAQLNVTPEMDEIWIAQEEPFPPHSSFTRKGQSTALKQQAELSGAFLGGLLRWGYPLIFQCGNTQWRQNVARQLSEETGQDITLYPQKWRDPQLAAQYNCKPQDSGKFRSQQWSFRVLEPWTVQRGGNEIPDFPPLVVGKTPRKEDSRAKAVQPDDRYDALAIMDWMRVEIYNTLGRRA
jgi:hypothetical protein